MDDDLMKVLASGGSEVIWLKHTQAESKRLGFEKFIAII